MASSAKQLFDELVEKHYLFGYLHPGRDPGRVGQSIERLTNTERDLLQGLTSADAANVRPDFAGHVGESGAWACLHRRRRP